MREGIVPWQLVVTRSALRPRRPTASARPAASGATCPGCDLVRDADGRWKVLEDNVRTPSGISYVLENRIAMSRLLPELFAGYDVRPVSHYPALLLDALQAAAPGGGENPVVVVWTPGPANSAYFEHAFLARQMGVELVEASDLVVRDALCYMRTTRGLARVDSIYRRIDDDFMDPLEFRLGLAARRAGADGRLPGRQRRDRERGRHRAWPTTRRSTTTCPEMIRYYLGEEPILDNLPTWLLADPEQRAFALERLHELVVKPTGESGGKGVFIGPLASEEQLEAQRGLLDAGARALDRAADGVALDGADGAAGRVARAAARRPAAVRRLRRRDQDRPGRADAGGPARGLDDREQLPGRRLQGHLGAGRGRPGAAPTAGPTRSRRRRCPACARRAGAARSSNSSSRRPRLMLARIAHDLYWLGRHLVRAEHTARMLDGLFHADLQGRADDPPRSRSRGTRCWRSWAPAPARGPAQRDDVVRLLTTDAENPVSIVSCVTAAREGARTLRDTISGRDVGVDQHLPAPAAAGTTSTPGLRTGPYSIYSLVKERSALFWGLTGRTMQKDEARAFLVAGGRIEAADMVLRMLRVALPPRPRRTARAPRSPRRDGNALALLRAVGGFQAFMRAAAAPPNAGAGRPLHALRARVPRLGGGLGRSRSRPRSSGWRASRRTRRPVLRVRRMLADLDFRARVSPGPEAVSPWLRPVQQELERLDAEIHDRYFHPSTVVTQTVTG